jgi:hypothetical protein
MPTRVAVCGLAVAVLILGAGCAADRMVGAQSVVNDDRGFTTIFDGKSMSGWEIIVEPGDQPEKKLRQDAFYLENGALACKGYGYHWFRYKEPLTDFVLRMEFKIAKDTNSGVCLRAKEKGAPPTTGFEVQIVDDIGKKPDMYTTGAIYDVVTPMYNASKPIGEWNEMEITMKGSLVVVVLNGLKVIDTDFAKLTKPIGKFDFAYANMPRSGYLALQDHWTPIWYRNIRLKKLSVVSGQ